MKYVEFILPRDEAEDWNEFRVLENVVKYELEAFAQSVSVLVISVSMCKPIVWNYVLENVVKYEMRPWHNQLVY